MRKPIVAGNWKCHGTTKEAVALIQALRAQLDGLDGVEIVVCPPLTALAAAHQALHGSRIGLGAQDVFWEAQGAFTGGVSAPMLLDVGCRYVIVGHSERRTHFGESDQIVQRKLLAALRHQLTPIVCIGETLAEREANQTFPILKRQLEGALREVPAADRGRVIIAYEPVWAIGTGRNATPEQAQEVHAFIRQWIVQQWGADAGDGLRLQYGGSVTAANAAGLLQQPDVDGALVGGASLKAEAFHAIVKAALDVKTVNR